MTFSVRRQARDTIQHISMSLFVTGKATALSEADLASKAASGQADPAEDADTVPGQAAADSKQDDDWEPAPTITRRAARRGTKDPTIKGRGGRKRQAVESDSQDSAEDEDEQHLASSRAHGLLSRRRRKQLVIEDENLADDLGLDDGEPDANSRRHSGAAAEADVRPVGPPESAVPSQASMDGYKHLNAGPSSIQNVAQTAPSDSSPNAIQDTDGTDTHEAAHVVQPRDDHAHQGPSDFPLLDAMLQPDTSDSYSAPGRFRPSQLQLQGEHLSADDHDPQTSIHVGQADSIVSGSGQQQEAVISEALPLSGPDVSPSRPPVKGSLRDRVKAFAALR